MTNGQDARTEPRPWRCKNFKMCHVEADPLPDGAIPDGWIGVVRYPGNKDERPERIGLFHDVGCMLAGIEGLAKAGAL